jgi:D-aspartate ligase
MWSGPRVGRQAVASPAALAELWPRVVEAGGDMVVQEAVTGPEARIESYHAYVNVEGELVAEFTGRKIRTRPRCYGHSTAVEITPAADVADLGREVLGRLELRGVAKVDFKRAPDRSLYLLEVNPRFNLWHHPGARAGVNLPALVYADLTGRARPARRPVRPVSAGAAPSMTCERFGSRAAASGGGCVGSPGAKRATRWPGMTRCRACACCGR